jgi:hypothetical protein
MNKVVPIDYHEISTGKILEPNTQTKVDFLLYKTKNENVDTECIDLLRCLCCFCILCSDSFDEWLVSLFRKDYS